MNDLIMLKLCALCNPVLFHLGIRPSGPFVILLMNGTFQDLSETMCIYDKVIITPQDSKKRLRELLITGYSESILINYDGSSQSGSLVNQVSALVKAGCIDGTPVLGMPFIVTNDILPDCVLEDGFYVPLSLSDIKPVAYDQYVPQIEKLALIEEKIKTTTREFTGNARLLMAALCFLYPSLHEKSDFDCCIDRVRELDLRYHEQKDMTGADQFFIRCLYRWIDGEQDILVCKLPVVSDVNIDRREKVFFFNDQNLFVSNKLFNAITASIQKTWSVVALKKALDDAGILKRGKSSTYLSKMSIFNEENQAMRFDMLKFELDRLNIPGNIDLLTLLEGKVENEN